MLAVAASMPLSLLVTSDKDSLHFIRSTSTHLFLMTGSASRGRVFRAQTQSIELYKERIHLATKAVAKLTVQLARAQEQVTLARARSKELKSVCYFLFFYYL